jgi:putative SOS response-associated peptidase YedK
MEPAEPARAERRLAAILAADIAGNSRLIEADEEGTVNRGEAFTLLTTDPSPDVTPIHDRQMVVLNRADWLTWLDLTRPESELLRPLSAGSLAVEQVR